MTSFGLCFNCLMVMQPDPVLCVLRFGSQGERFLPSDLDTKGKQRVGHPRPPSSEREREKESHENDWRSSSGVGKGHHHPAIRRSTTTSLDGGTSFIPDMRATGNPELSSGNFPAETPPFFHSFLSFCLFGGRRRPTNYDSV